eukprot:TRINITY_DN12542_c0_g1_i1.p1 TRINITY_DN12542_c0_g1~~TRINITY_DN12542_c0_g1_i1.p1  ORF type:complete len:1081 (-),score=84.81 TRINITY_DN12542_c0_g1_i1:22-3264(-)
MRVLSRAALLSLVCSAVSQPCPSILLTGVDFPVETTRVNGSCIWQSTFVRNAECGRSPPSNSALLRACTVGFRVDGIDEEKWLSAGYDEKNTRTNPDGIKLSLANANGFANNWVVGSVQPGSTGVSAAPSIAGDLVFATDWQGGITATSRSTGLIVWNKGIIELLPPRANPSRQWTSPIVSQSTPAIFTGEDRNPAVIIGYPADRAINTTQRYQGPCFVSALDGFTGRLLWRTEVDDHPYCTVPASLSVLQEENRAFGGVANAEYLLAGTTYGCCTSRGKMFSLDTRTGRILWSTPTITRSNWVAAAGGWAGAPVTASAPAIDVDDRAVYFATGPLFSVPTAVDACLANGTFSAAKQPISCWQAFVSNDVWPDSILRLDIDSGTIVWGHPTKYLDVWTNRCETPTSGNYSTDLFRPGACGANYGFTDSPTVVTVNGEKLLLANQRSGSMRAVHAASGVLKYTRTFGAGHRVGGGQGGVAFDASTGIAVVAYSGNLADPRKNTNGLGDPVSSSIYVYPTYPVAGGVYACGGGMWAGINASTGEVLWTSLVPGTSSGVVCGTSSSSRTVEDWETLPDPSIPSTALVGTPCASASGPLNTSRWAHGAPTIGPGGVVFAGDLTGFVNVLDLKTGNCKTRLACTAGGVYGGMSLADGSVYFGCGYARAVDLKAAASTQNGNSLMSFTVSNPNYRVARLASPQPLIHPARIGIVPVCNSNTQLACTVVVLDTIPDKPRQRFLDAVPRPDPVLPLQFPWLSREQSAVIWEIQGSIVRHNTDSTVIYRGAIFRLWQLEDTAEWVAQTGEYVSLPHSNAFAYLAADLERRSLLPLPVNGGLAAYQQGVVPRPDQPPAQSSQTIWGAASSLGWRAYTRHSPQGDLLRVGATFPLSSSSLADLGALQNAMNLTSIPSPSSFSIAGAFAKGVLYRAYPSVAPMFTQPSVDITFAIATSTVRNNISAAPSSCSAVGSGTCACYPVTCAASTGCDIVPTLPADYVTAAQCQPLLGRRSVSSNADTTLPTVSIGTFNGGFTLVGVRVTVSFLSSRNRYWCGTIPAVANPPGAWPSKICLEYDDLAEKFDVSLSDF